jgi:integrase
MKTVKQTVQQITQLGLEASRNEMNPDIQLQIKEKSIGRNSGVFTAYILASKEIDFYFLYFMKGKSKSLKIGRYGKSTGQLSIAQARAEFKKLSLIYNSGIDPKAQIKAQAEELEREHQQKLENERIKNCQGSVGQLSEFYLEYLKQTKGDTHFRNVKQAFSKNLSVINLNKKASDVTKMDIISILHVIEERGSLIMANRMRTYLSSMFQYGIYFDDSTDVIKKQTQFYISSNPVSQVQKIIKHEARGERTLHETEVKLFWNALDNSKMSIFRINVFKMMLLTGSRVEEMAGLRWDEIDLKGKIITLPAARTKNKLPHIIPLNIMAYEIIKTNPRLNDIYVFPSDNNQSCLKVDGFSQAITRLLTTVSITKFVPRDLRRTFKTLTGKAGIPKEVRDRLQNHALTDVSSLHYDKYDYLKEKREAMDIWNDYLENILSNEIIM